MSPRKKQTKEKKSIEVKSKSKPSHIDETNGVSRVTRSRAKKNEDIARDLPSCSMQVKKARKDQPDAAVSSSSSKTTIDNHSQNNGTSEILNKIEKMHQEKYENVCERLSIITTMNCITSKIECINNHSKNDVSTY